jgi:ABC-type multidrug transport system fused ATPase/permease subunit
MTFLQRMRQKLHIDDPEQRTREFRWLLQMMYRQRRTVVLICFLSIAGTIFGLTGNVISKYLIDSITALNLSGVYRSAWLFLILVPGSLILSNMASFTGAKLRIRAKNELQKSIFNRILNARWESLEPYRNGDLLNLLNMDVSTVSDATITYLPSKIVVLPKFYIMTMCRFLLLMECLLR